MVVDAVLRIMGVSCIRGALWLCIMAASDVHHGCIVSAMIHIMYPPPMYTLQHQMCIMGALSVLRGTTGVSVIV